MLLISLLLAAVTAFFVPPDAQYLGYYDLKTLACLFSVLAVVGALLASLGAIQPGREDEEDKKLGVIRKAQGRSYSTYFKLGDWEIPLDFAQPSSGPLYIGAKIAWAIEEMGDDVNAPALIGTVLYGSALETGNQLFDNSFLSGFSALFSG